MIEQAYNALIFRLRVRWQKEGLCREEATARAFQDVDAMTNTELLDALSQSEEPQDD